MKFGRDGITDSEIINPKIKFFKEKSAGQFRLFVGGTKISDKEVADALYPKGTKAKDYLKTYSTLFNTIELNSTHYRVPSQDNLQKYMEETPDDFRFSPKVIQNFSHFSNLSLQFSKFVDFKKDLLPLSSKIGLTFLQLHEKFGKARQGELISFLKKFRKEFSDDLALEIRNGDLIISEQVVDTLAELGIILIITDTLGRRDVVHGNLTTDKMYLRFVGDELKDTDTKRLDFWIDTINKNKDKLSDVYIYLHISNLNKMMEFKQYIYDRI